MKLGARIGLGVAIVATALVATLAMPVDIWRTGEVPSLPLALTESGPPAPMTRRVWIDTDAACGSAPKADADDCFALLLLARALQLEIVGISMVHGNAPLETVAETLRALRAAFESSGIAAPPLYRGSAASMSSTAPVAREPAHDALRDALQAGPLTIVALGPLTNIASVLDGRPDLAANVVRLVAVMGRRKGHLFHPSEGRGGGMLLGHGPVFSDFNYAQDREAAERVARLEVPTTLVPYEVARNIVVTAADLDRMSIDGGASAWVASRARLWLDYWHRDIGVAGFYPFDLLAAAYVIDPRMFDCARVAVWISPPAHPLDWLGFRDTLHVGVDSEQPADARVASRALYCPRTHEAMHGWLMRRLVGAR